MDKRYQLIYPYVNNKIYEFSTLMKCAKFCCSEIEKNFISEGLTRVTHFIIKDIDTKEIFTFNLTKPLEKTNDDILLTNNIETNKIDILENKISKLENDIQNIKKYLKFIHLNNQKS